MKKLSFICIVCLCATTQTNAQLRDTTLNMNTHKVDANSLLLKSKKQKTAAWLMLGGGAGIAIAGLAIMIHDASYDASAVITTVFTLGLVIPEEHKHSAAGPILAIAGTGAMLGSIPLFTSAAKNKRKANLMVKDENVFFNPQLNIKEHMLAIGVKINL
jgi:hypothetical protein